MLTPKMSGLFDCREFDGKTKEHSARRLKADTENIVFSAMFIKEELPDQFKVNGAPDPMLKERSTKKERAAAAAENRQPVLDAFVAAFKIGQTTKWFDKYGHATDRPTNEELETERWNVQIDFSRREKDPSNPLKASGYWVNAIMVAKVESNPFEGQAFEQAPEDDAEQDSEDEAQKPQPLPSVSAEVKSEGDDDLPF